MPSTKPVMPPSGGVSTVQLDDTAFVRFVADLYDAEHVVASDPRGRGARVVLERPEHRADRHLHGGRRINAFEDEEPALLEGLVEAAAHVGVAEQIDGDAADAGAEGEIVAD